ncbi:MAG: hypothetical protein WCK77_00880 [Verrucomicrobiota bacterium]
MTFHRSSLVGLACACALAGCAAPKKALVIERAPVPAVKTGDDPAATEALSKPAHDDGFRTGDLLVLPKDTEYRATNPRLPTVNAGGGTVIVNPPSAPKPKPQGKPEE